MIQLELADSYRGLERLVLAEAVYRSILAKVNSRIPSYDEVVFEISRLRTVECQVQLEKMDDAFKMVREALFNNRVGYGASVAVMLFLIMSVYITYFLTRMLRAER